MNEPSGIRGAPTARSDEPLRPLGDAERADGIPTLRQVLTGERRLAQAGWSAERWAVEIRDVACALGRLHGRGLVHGDVRPEQLVFDATNRLAPSERAATPGAMSQLAIRTRGRTFTRGGRPRGADRYVAPELFEGEQGPAVDQFALGVTAREVLARPGAPPLTVPVRDVLQRATAPRPGQRFASVEDFGDALVDAMTREAPSTLADRAARASAATRAAWEPAAIGAAVMAVASFNDARDGRDMVVPVAGVLVAALLVTAIVVLVFCVARFTAMLRSAPRRLQLPIVYRRGVAPLAWVVVVAVGCLLDGSLEDVVPRAGGMLFVVYGVRGLLAKPPDESGEWLVALLRRWDRQRLRSRLRHRVLTAGGVGLVLAWLVAPTLAGRALHEVSRSSIGEFGPAVTVWNFRAAIFRGDAAEACRLVALRPDPAREDCRRMVIGALTPLQRSDPAARRPRDVYGGNGDGERFQVEESYASQGTHFWWLLDPNDRNVGVAYTAGSSLRKLDVMISRRAPFERSERLVSTWLYELEWHKDRWAIVAFRVCDIAAPGSGESAKCVITDHATPRRVRVFEEAAARARAAHARRERP